MSRLTDLDGIKSAEILHSLMLLFNSKIIQAEGRSGPAVRSGPAALRGGSSGRGKRGCCRILRAGHSWRLTGISPCSGRELGGSKPRRGSRDSRARCHPCRGTGAVRRPEAPPAAGDNAGLSPQQQSSRSWGDVDRLLPR